MNVRLLHAGDGQAVLTLRYRVLDQPLGVTEKTELSANDLGARNILVGCFEGDRLVSVVRFDRLSQTEYLVRRMATAPDVQGMGYGRQVFEMAQAEAVQRGAQRIVLHARQTAIGFYEKLGYQLTGHSEVHDGDENLEMVKRI